MSNSPSFFLSQKFKQSLFNFKCNLYLFLSTVFFLLLRKSSLMNLFSSLKFCFLLWVFIYILLSFSLLYAFLYTCHVYDAQSFYHCTHSFEPSIFSLLLFFPNVGILYSIPFLGIVCYLFFHHLKNFICDLLFFLVSLSSEWSIKPMSQKISDLF